MLSAENRAKKALASIHLNVKNVLQIAKVYDDAKVPTRGTPGSAGLDLYSYENGTILPRSRDTVDTGIRMKIPEHYCGMIWPRSGLSAKNGIETGAGLIDSDYTGSIMVILHNHTDIPFNFTKGMRIAQIVIMPYLSPEIEVVDKLDESKRGEGGFGSTGLH